MKVLIVIVQSFHLVSHNMLFSPHLCNHICFSYLIQSRNNFFLAPKQTASILEVLIWCVYVKLMHALQLITSLCVHIYRYSFVHQFMPHLLRKEQLGKRSEPLTNESWQKFKGSMCVHPCRLLYNENISAGTRNLKTRRKAFQKICKKLRRKKSSQVLQISGVYFYSNEAPKVQTHIANIHYYKIISDQRKPFWLFLSGISIAQAMKMVHINAVFIYERISQTGQKHSPVHIFNAKTASSNSINIPAALEANYLSRKKLFTHMITT